MKSAYSSLMHSRYFNPAFNSAIFDGPVRIYFAQFHESLALKIYFMSQQKLAQELAQAKETSKKANANILVMIYPTVESFELSFENRQASPYVVESWNDDMVIGLRGPIEDHLLENLIEEVGKVMREWNPKVIQTEVTSASL